MLRLALYFKAATTALTADFLRMMVLTESVSASSS
jgi:hypothetical protein